MSEEFFEGLVTNRRACKRVMWTTHQYMCDKAMVMKHATDEYDKHCRLLEVYCVKWAPETSRTIIDRVYPRKDRATIANIEADRRAVVSATKFWEDACAAYGEARLEWRAANRAVKDYIQAHPEMCIDDLDDDEDN